MFKNHNIIVCYPLNYVHSTGHARQYYRTYISLRFPDAVKSDTKRFLSAMSCNDKKFCQDSSKNIILGYESQDLSIQFFFLITISGHFRCSGSDMCSDMSEAPMDCILQCVA